MIFGTSFTHLPLVQAPMAMALLLGFIAGAVIGVLHFRALKAQVAALARDPSLARLFALQAARIVVSTLALALIAVALGGPALVAAALGVLAARTVAVRMGGTS